MPCGYGGDHVAGFINIDPVAVGNWAERNCVAYASYQERAAHAETYRMVGESIEQVNRDLAADEKLHASQITRFLILHKELDADDGEITRTRKVRRSTIFDKYGELVDALYSGAENRRVSTEVTFEDGRRGVIEADLQIRTLRPHAPRAQAA